jgi:Fe(3+) dicitrate transport protein
MRANDRQYVSQGIQTRFKNKLKLGDVRHNLEYGARYHNDQELRFQNQDTYNMSAGQISLKTSGAPGGAGDRVAKASALSFFLEDEIIIDKLTIVPGARFEHITSKREDAGKAVRTNNTDVFIPGISASYLLTEKTAVFSGVHKGFAPPSPSNSSSAAEESINYEAGFRFKDKTKFFETVAFYNDYSNLLGSDTASGGGSGDGDQFNGGAVTAYGLEVVGGVDLKADILKQAVKFPLSLSYTYNHAEFGSSFDTKDTIKEWGKVQKGDELPYIAPHQFGLSAGLEVDKVSLYLSGKFVSAMRATAGSGSIPKSEKIPSHFVADFSGFYEFEKNRSIFVAVDNIFNNEYLVSLRPSGMRPGKPLAARVGVSIGF